VGPTAGYEGVEHSAREGENLVGYAEQALTRCLQRAGVVMVLVYARHASGSAMVLTPKSAATACPTADSTWVRTSRALLLADLWMKPLHVTLLFDSCVQSITTRCHLLLVPTSTGWR
jgi:hypothetical protein